MVRKPEENVIQRKENVRNTMPVFVCSEKMANGMPQVSKGKHDEGEQ
jgi:hypothetical protein